MGDLVLERTAEVVDRYSLWCESGLQYNYDTELPRRWRSNQQTSTHHSPEPLHRVLVEQKLRLGNVAFLAGHGIRSLENMC